jgi:hypothetical protein
VTIRGTAFDTTKGRNRVHIVVNDTLRKFRESKTPNWDNYKKLTEDTTINLFAKSDGKFQVTANKTDSIFFQSFRHIQKVYSVSDLLKMKKVDIRLDPEICIPYVRCEDTLPTNVYVFVGQKLKVDYEPEPYYCDVITMDSRFNAEYKILEQEVGHYPNDTIRFIVFDHYGRPSFSKYETVLLFVSEYCGKLYHEKYQYFDLYKTKDGKWASPGDPYKYDSYHKKNIVAQNITFADTVQFDISKLSEAAIKQQYPAPFYKIEGQRAIPVMGSYIDDLLTVKKDGVLNARKIKLD